MDITLHDIYTKQLKLLSINNNGGSYIHGAPYPPIIRQRIMEDLIANNFKHGLQKEIAIKYKVSESFVNKLYKIAMQERHGVVLISSKQGYTKPSILNEHHVWYINVLLLQQPSLYLHELQFRLSEDLGVEASIPTLCNCLRKLGHTYKKMIRINERRLHPNNIARRINYLLSMQTYSFTQLFFFDESGFTGPQGLRKYGHGVGRITELQEMTNKENATLMAVMNCDGMFAVDLVETTVDATILLRFFISQVLPIIPHGSLIIMDNAAIHHAIEANLELLFNIQGCELVFLPAYSPDLNPIENAFGKIKIMCRRFWDAYINNMYQTVIEACQLITANDARNWFKYCGYSL